MSRAETGRICSLHVTHLLLLDNLIRYRLFHALFRLLLVALGCLIGNQGWLLFLQCHTLSDHGGNGLRRVLLRSPLWKFWGLRLRLVVLQILSHWVDELQIFFYQLLLGVWHRLHGIAHLPDLILQVFLNAFDRIDSPLFLAFEHLLVGDAITLVHWLHMLPSLSALPTEATSQ